MCMCVCVRACVRACVCVCVGGWVYHMISVLLQCLSVSSFHQTLTTAYQIRVGMAEPVWMASMDTHARALQATQELPVIQVYRNLFMERCFNQIKTHERLKRTLAGLHLTKHAQNASANFSQASNKQITH